MTAPPPSSSTSSSATALEIPVILLKTASKPTDPYETQFRAHPPYAPRFVPVLSHQHVNHAALTTALTEELDNYSKLIVTSQRAVEALGSAVAGLRASNHDLTPLLSRIIYVVGPATAAAIVALGFTASNVYGADCGNGAALADYILSQHPSSPSPPPALKPLLFLVGEIRRDVIHKALAGAGIPMQEMVVYETRVMPGFRGAFEEAVWETRKARRRWVIVFSPQGAEVALDVLNAGDSGEGEKEGGRGGEKEGEGEWRLAAIGPTTEEFLKEKVGRAPDVVAKKPTPVSLWEALESCAGVVRRTGGVDYR